MKIETQYWQNLFYAYGIVPTITDEVTVYEVRKFIVTTFEYRSGFNKPKEIEIPYHLIILLYMDSTSLFLNSMGPFEIIEHFYRDLLSIDDILNWIYFEETTSNRRTLGDVYYDIDYDSKEITIYNYKGQFLIPLEEDRMKIKFKCSGENDEFYDHSLFEFQNGNVSSWYNTSYDTKFLNMTLLSDYCIHCAEFHPFCIPRYILDVAEVDETSTTKAFYTTYTSKSINIKNYISSEVFEKINPNDIFMKCNDMSDDVIHIEPYRQFDQFTIVSLNGYGYLMMYNKVSEISQIQRKYKNIVDKTFFRIT